MTVKPHIVWLRQDLRLADQPAVAVAAAAGPVLFVYVLDDDGPGQWRLGGAARWWLHHSLTALADAIQARGGALILRRGDAVAALAGIVQETDAAAVHATRHYEPWARRQEALLERRLTGQGARFHLHPSSLLAEPDSLSTHAGTPFKVFTPFWRAWQDNYLPSRPLPAPAALPAPARLPPSGRLADWRLTPQTPDWAHGLAAHWTPGEAGAHARLDAFIGRAAAVYGQQRDRVAEDGTSQLSPHLHWGEISANQVRARLMHAAAPEAAMPFIRQLLWRDFSHHLLAADPAMAERAWNPRFRDFPWRDDAAALRAWQRGRTGYPIVDAAMRALWHTGFMHNRARMIAASFLTKDLLLPWQAGAAWFWDTLADADLANNSAGWQWVAGSGADAAPYIRVFNPVLQGRKFDPDGSYVRRWVPELARLPSAHIHAPWQAPQSVLEQAGVRLGQTYPHPIIDHDQARRRALNAHRTLSAAADALYQSA